MAASVNRVDEGTITIAHGFTAGGTYAGIKTYSEDKMDIGMLVSDRPCAAAGVFTTSSIVSPTVTANRETLAAGHLLRGLVVNSGIANAGVGEQGYIDAKGMAALGAEAVGVKPEEMLVFSTGIIGVELPMTLIKTGVEQIALSGQGGNDLARAMMTTDTHPKEVGVTVDFGRDGGTHRRSGQGFRDDPSEHGHHAVVRCHRRCRRSRFPAFGIAGSRRFFPEHAHRRRR